MRLWATGLGMAIFGIAAGKLTVGSIIPEVLMEAVMCITGLIPFIHRSMVPYGFPQNPTYVPVTMNPMGGTADITCARC